MRLSESSLRTQGPIRCGDSFRQWVEGLFTSLRPGVMGPCVRRDDCGEVGCQIHRSLMIIPCHADASGDVVVARRKLQASAGGLLADGGAIELLPGRLVGRIAEAALCLEFGPSP